MAVVNIETNQGAFMTTGRVEGNEIVKEEDFTFSFQSLIGNISKFSRMIFEAEKDFVIGGKVTVDTGTNVKIAPVFGVCMSTGTPFGIAEELQGFSIAVEQGGTDRIDILEVRGVYQDFDQQQRAFNDLDNDTITYQTINTKTGMSIEVVVKKGTAGAAPSVTPGWVKLCEIHYTANATDLSDDDIKNITADISTLDNDDWTTDVDCVYNIGYISDVNERFRVQHNEDGTHADDCINSDSLDIGTGAKQVNGSVLPIGGSVTIPGQTTQITDSIVSTMTKLATVITSLYNAYLKYGTYGINGELKISSLADGNNDLTKPISVYAAGDGTAVIKIDGSAVLSIDADGRLSTNGYTPNSNNNLVTQAVTSAIAGDLATLTAYVNSLAPQLDQSTYTNGTLSSGTGGRFNPYTSVEITRASTENIASLSGIASIDGSEPTNGDLILLKDQTDKTENGIWAYNPNTDWSRPSVSPADFNSPADLKGLLFNIKGGATNAGKMFYMPKVSFTDSAAFGTDDIEFLEYFGSIQPKAHKLAYRDENACVKSAEPNASNDVATRFYVDPIVASSATITGAPTLKNGMSLKIMFTSDLAGTDTSTGLSLTYNTVPIPVKVNKSGSLSNMLAHEISSSSYKYIQAYTTLEFIYLADYDGLGNPAFVVVGNPVVLSSSDYTIYADGKVGDGDIGDIKPRILTNIPYGWLLCNGQSVLRTAYPKLFEYFNTQTYDGVHTLLSRFGYADTTHFNMPDLRESTLKGTGTTSKSSVHYDSDGLTLGEFIDDRIQIHKHNDSGHDHAIGYTPTGLAGGPYTMNLLGGASLGNTNPGTANIGDPVSSITAGISAIRGGTTTEVKAVGVNYIIKAM